MDMFKMIKEAAAMKSKLSEMERLLKDKIIEIEENGIKVKLNAKTEILDIKISPEVLKQSVQKVEKDLLNILQHATRQAHDLMMQEAKAITGGMKIPGLM